MTTSVQNLAGAQAVVPRVSPAAQPGKVYAPIPHATALPVDLDRAPTVARSSDLKTVHRYSGSGGKLIIELHTPPQIAPTCMGGSRDRGRGSLRGRVQLYCMEKNDRVSDVRIKLKAEVSIAAPRSTDSSDALASFSGTPSTSRTSTREMVLVQLDQRLRAPNATYRAVEGGTPQANREGSFGRKGVYEWQFEFDIPALANKRAGNAQPFPNVGLSYPSSYVLEADAATDAAKREEWASVKWYLKCTIEHSGLFRGKDRLIVPFIYLPPPPESLHKTLIRRQALSQQIQGLLSLVSGPVALPDSLVEKQSRWRSYQCEISEDSLDVNHRRGLLKRMFTTKRVELWAVTIPADPLAVYPLRSTIPIVLTLMNGSTSPIVSHPHVFLIQRVQLRGRATATHHKMISHARVFPARVAKNGMQQWFGAVQFPNWCSPSFETAILGLDYYLLIKPTVKPESEAVLEIPVGLFCPPPRVKPADAQDRTSLRSNASMSLLPRSPPRSPPRSTSRTPSMSSVGAAVPAPMRPQMGVSQSVANLRGSASHAQLPAMRVQESPPLPPRLSMHTAAPRLPEGAPGLPVAGPGLPAAAPAVPPIMPNQPLHAPGLPPVPHPAVQPAVPAPAAPAARAPPLPARPATDIRPSRVGSPASRPSAPAGSLPADTGADTEHSIISDYADNESRTTADDSAAASSTPAGIVHDAGGLTQEEEYAWTMNVLENALADAGAANDLELPPSYFEATGIRDVE